MDDDETLGHISQNNIKNEVKLHSFSTKKKSNMQIKEQKIKKK